MLYTVTLILQSCCFILFIIFKCQICEESKICHNLFVNDGFHARVYKSQTIFFALLLLRVLRNDMDSINSDVIDQHVMIISQST